MDVAANWPCEQNNLNKLSFPYPKESPDESCVQLVPYVFENVYGRYTTDRQRDNERQTPGS